MVAGGDAAPAGAAAGDVCAGASYFNRIDNPGYYNWCLVPSTSYDVVLFGGLAVVLACLLQGKLNTLMVLAAGAVLMAIAWPVNLGALGNSLAIWLGISPWQLFFYVFLPPLLLDAAVRIDWYLFKKSVVQVFTFAFLVVGATCVAMIPIMLYILDLRKYGWEWIHACMFGAMIASTDAVAIVSIMKTSGGPKRLRVLLEGESLLNDASGLTLFEVFFHILHTQMSHPEDQPPVPVIVGQVFLAVVQLGLIGFVMGMVFGVLTRLFLRYMRYAGAGHDQEVALTLGMAYLAYWVTGIPCKGSGVVAVAVMGLYGASTNCWDMSTAAHHTFDGFWETLAFAVNALVFMWSGAHVVNFFIRASADLQQHGLEHDLQTTLWLLPIIYIILMILRFGLSSLFRPLFMLIKGDINTKEMIFVTIAGLRGSASLIMGSAVVTQQFSKVAESPETFSVVKSMMVFWTAGFVLLTLAINAPMLPFVLRVTGLSKVPDKQLERRKRAVDALADHSRMVLEQLRDAEDELLAGVDWAQVAAFVDHGRKYSAFTGRITHSGPIGRFMLRLWVSCCCCCPCLPGWLTGSNAAAAAAAAAAEQQQQHFTDHKGKDSKDPGHNGKDQHEHSSHSHNHRNGHKSRRRCSKHRERTSHKLQNTTGSPQHGLKGVPAATGAEGTLQLQPMEQVVPQLLLSGSGDFGGHLSAVRAAPAAVHGQHLPNGAAAAAADGGGRGVPTGSAAARHRDVNGTAAPGSAAVRLTGESQGHLWGSSREETTEAEKGSHSATESSSGSDQNLPSVRQQGSGRRNGHLRSSSQRHRDRRRQAQMRHVSGDVSDTEGSSSSDGSSSDGSSSGSSGSDSMVSRYDSNLINDVLPFLQTHEVDVMLQECPFLMSKAAQQHLAASAAAAGAAAAAAAVSAGAGQQGQGQEQQMLPVMQLQHLQQQHKGYKGFFNRWRRAPAAAAAYEAADGSSKHTAASGNELQRASDISSSNKQQQSLLRGSSSPGRHGLGDPTAASGSHLLSFTADLNSQLPSAFAAASALRGSAGSDAAAGGSGRPPPAGVQLSRSANRSLASRSAAPALIYGGTGTYAGKGAFAGGSASFEPPSVSSQAGHRRKGSDGSGLGAAASTDLNSAQQQMSRPLSSASGAAAGTAAAAATAGSWGLAGSWMNLQQLGSVSTAGSPRATSAAPGGRAFQTGTEKALGRRSGMYGRNLGTRSTTLADRYGGAAEPFTPFQPFHLPESEAAEGAPLARQSRSYVNQQDPQAEGSVGAGRLRRASSERERHSEHIDSYDAAAVAVDMVSLERSNSSKMHSAGTAAAVASAAGGNGGAAALPSLGAGLGRPAGRGLASRSVGMAGAYAAYGQQGYRGSMPGDSNIGSADMQQWSAAYRPGQRASPNPELKSLATHSSHPHLPPVAPVAPSLATISTGLAAYNKHSAAAAAAAAAGADGGSARQLPWAPPSRAERGLATHSVPAAGVVAAAAAAAVAGSNAVGSTGGGNTGNLMSILRSSIGIGRASGRSGKVGGKALTEDDDGVSDLSGASDLGKPFADDVPAVCDADLADARSWLLTGLKRYFHAKRMEGLLSAKGLRILDSGCEVLLEHPEQPLRLWSIISGDCANNTVVRLLTYLLFGCRQAAVGMMTWGRVGRILAWPLKVAASMLQRPLNKVLLMSVEVAMEYLMGLTTSPHVEQLQENEAWASLLAEISSEAGQVAQFLIDREIEAPERYSAVQSYRVAMAVLRQQRLFVETLFESGMLDSAETSQLSHPVEAAERRLELLGPVWRAPSVMEVLRQLPFLRGHPQSVLDFFVKHGQLVMLGSGKSLPLGKVLYVVQSGIVKVTYSPDMGEIQEYFLGAGGLINLYCSITGETMPGMTEAVAQGNALGKGPVLFCLGAKGLRRMAAAAETDPAFQQVELDMYRLAGLFLLERLKPQLDMEASQALARLAPITAPGTGGGGHRDKKSSRQQRAAWVRQRLAAMRNSLKQQLVMAELLELTEGATVTQDGHVMLMKGTIQVKVADDSIMAQPGTADIARWMANTGRHQHQSILPWFWGLMSDEDLHRAPAGTPQQPLPVSITAGVEGAVLLVCPSQSAAATTEPPLLPAAAAGAPSLLPPMRAPSQGLAQGSAGVGLKPSILTRHSPGTLGRISPVALGAPVPSAAMTGAQGGVSAALRHTQNTYSRRNLAAAVAAADALMDPFPGLSPAAVAGGGAGAAAGGATAAAGRAGRMSPLGPAAGVAPFARSPAEQRPVDGTSTPARRSQEQQESPGLAPLARRSPELARKSGSQHQAAAGLAPLARRSQELQNGSRHSSGGSGGLPTLQRTSSNVPLAGAQGDNAATVGVDMRAGPLSALGVSDPASAAAAERALGSSEPAGGTGAAAAAAAETADGAARGRREEQLKKHQMRRSKSQRPLRAGVGGAGERRVGGGG